MPMLGAESPGFARRQVLCCRLDSNRAHLESDSLRRAYRAGIRSTSQLAVLTARPNADDTNGLGPRADPGTKTQCSNA